MRRLTTGFVAVVALVGVLYAATTGSAASTRAASNVVRTWNCHTSAINIDTMVQVKTWATGASVATGDPSAPENFVSFARHETNYTVGSRCRPVSRRVVMSRHELVASQQPDADCSAPAHVLIRLVLGLDDNNKPTSAKIEIAQPHSRFKPLAQVQWTTDSSTTYHRPITCTTHN